LDLPGNVLTSGLEGLNFRGLTILQASGLPSNMCVLKGCNTTLAKTTTNAFPFGLWFANADTLYVADEGNDTTTFSGGQYTAAAAQTTAGLQKWSSTGPSGSWPTRCGRA
jgi:hypothetical protein